MDDFDFVPESCVVVAMVVVDEGGGDRVGCIMMLDVTVCVLRVRPSFLYPSTSSTTSANADSSILRRGTKVNRTYGTHKRPAVCISLFFYQQYLVLLTMVPRIRDLQVMRSQAYATEVLIWGGGIVHTW